MFDLKAHHGGISVPNLSESIAWYTHMLGFELENCQNVAQIPADIVFENVIDGTPMDFLRDNAGNLLELIEFPALWAGQGAQL